MTRSHGSVPEGRRLRMGSPAMVIAKRRTLVAGLRRNGMVAPNGARNGPINGDWFEDPMSPKSAGARTQARPTWSSWNNTLSSTKRVAVKEKVRSGPVSTAALPPAPYSPDFNPIEKGVSSRSQGHDCE